MKKNKLSFTVLGLCSLFLICSLYSCRKNNFSSYNVSEIFYYLGSDRQQFSFQAGQSITLEGNKGTRIHFGQSAFRDNAGNIVTSGTIDVWILEMPSGSDMILNGVTTQVESGRFLQSGGAINLLVKQNDQTLYPAEPFGVDFRQDSARNDSMSIFVGGSGFTAGGRQTQQVGQSFSSGDSSQLLLNWREFGSNTQGGTVLDIASLINYYSFDQVPQFNWINCDMFFEDTRPITNIELNIMGQEIEYDGAIAFAVLPEINGVIGLRQNSSDANKLSLGNIARLPVGMKAHFIVMAKVKGEYFFSKQEDITIANNLSSDLLLEKKTINEIKSEIASL